MRLQPRWCWRVPMTLGERYIAPVITARSIGEARERALTLGEDILGVAFERSWAEQGVLRVGDPVPLHHTVKGHKRQKEGA